LLNGERMALENASLQVQLRAQLKEVQQSRARLVDAAQRERRQNATFTMGPSSSVIRQYRAIKWCLARGVSLSTLPRGVIPKTKVALYFKLTANSLQKSENKRTELFWGALPVRNWRSSSQG
jgi:hypothetical protein